MKPFRQPGKKFIFSCALGARWIPFPFLSEAHPSSASLFVRPKKNAYPDCVGGRSLFIAGARKLAHRRRPSAGARSRSQARLDRTLRAAKVSFEDREGLLGHKSGTMTPYCSAAELTNLIEAAERACAGSDLCGPFLAGSTR